MKIATREAWLSAAAMKLSKHWKDAGYPLPEAIRFSIGFTSTGRAGRGHIGECWSSSASADGAVEIFIRADRFESLDILKILAHELVHAAVPPRSGHGPIFKKAALRLGLEGKMIHALPGAALCVELEKIINVLGPVPHAQLNFSGEAADKPKKQGTRLLKAECAECGYTVRVTKKWIDAAGAPHCPHHGEMEIV